MWMRIRCICEHMDLMMHILSSLTHNTSTDIEIAAYDGNSAVDFALPNPEDDIVLKIKLTDQAGNSVETADAMSFWINTDAPDVELTLADSENNPLTSGLGSPINEPVTVKFRWLEWLADDAFTIPQDVTVSFDDVVTNEISLGNLSSRSRNVAGGTLAPIDENYTSALTISSNAEKENIVIRVPKNNVPDIASNTATGTESINFTYDITRPVLSAITATGCFFIKY